MELLDHMDYSSICNFLGVSILFSTVAIPIYQQYSRVSFSPHPCQCLLSVVFLIIAILIGVR